MYLFADIVVRNLPAPLATFVLSTCAHERLTAVNAPLPLGTLPDIPSGSLLCARLRN
ncbi:hypothetical protein C4K39_5017 [Pseudomonas sessilinigenes]|nr:hypothetical protein C4K39_5017 [Pseudomonas sessilinigenes]